jgi:glycine/sarcosine N-methyltransferase
MDNEQNDFYTSISKFYTEIFPYNPIQLQFLKKNLGDLYGQQILDIGCATGELAFQLAQEGSQVTGIDLNEDLLGQAIQKKSFPNLNFQLGDMLKLEDDFLPGKFDAVLCFGNTLVHLPTFSLIRQMFSGVNSILKSGGKFLIQILNYDYILDDKISQLPNIETEVLKFIRKYKFEKNSPIIRFETDLLLKSKNRIISNETSLLALRSKELTKLLIETGFSDIRLFSDFKQNLFGGEHLPLVAECRK